MVTSSYPTHAGDVAGVFVEGFTRTLRERGHDVEVVAPWVAEGATRGRSSADGVTRLRYLWPSPLQRTFHGAGAPENLRKDPLAWPGALAFPPVLFHHLRRRVQAGDAVVCHWALPAGLVGALLPTRARLVVVTHGADIHLLERLPGARLLATRIASRAATITFVSEAHRARFEAVLGRPLISARVLAMGVDAPTLSPGFERAAFRAAHGLEGCVVFTMGRLVPIKGLDVLLRALAGFSKTTLVVAGDGPERDALQSLAKHLRVPTRFEGVVRGGTKAAWLSAADVFVLPSRPLPDGREEGAPTALIEAMLARLPVIASDTGGVSSLVAHGHTGLLVEPGSPAALAAALADVQEEPQAARARAEDALAASQTRTWTALGPDLDALVVGP